MKLFSSSSLNDFLPSAVSVGMQMAQNEMNKAWQEKMYNQYQSPSAMVRQYQEAGLNPALMYGQNLQTSFSQPASQNMLDPIGSAMVASQIRYMNAQTDNLNADTESKRIENTFKPQLLSLDLSRGWLDYDNTLAGIHKINSEIKEIDSRTMLNDFQARLTDEQIRLVIANTSKTQIETANEALRSAGIEANNRLIAAQVLTELGKPLLQSAEIALMSQQSYMYSAQTDEIRERERGIRLDNFLKDWQNEFVKINGYEPSKNLLQTFMSFIGSERVEFNRQWSGSHPQTQSVR